VGVEGRLTEMTHTEIASASQWEGDPQEFLDALIYGEFIDNTSEGLVLHDWYDYAGKLIESRERERERSRKRRETTSGQPAVDQRSTVGTVSITTSIFLLIVSPSIAYTSSQFPQILLQVYTKLKPLIPRS